MRGGYQEAIEGWSTGIELGGKPSSLDTLSKKRSNWVNVEGGCLIRESNSGRPAPLARSAMRPYNADLRLKDRAALG